MMRYKVVLVPFPFDDLSSSKVRPAVCLTEPTSPYRHIVLAFITSRIPQELSDTDLVLSMEENGFETTGLRVSSTLQLHRLMTVTTSLIKRELGALTPRMQKKIKERLRTLFNLS